MLSICMYLHLMNRKCHQMYRVYVLVEGTAVTHRNCVFDSAVDHSSGQGHYHHDLMFAVATQYTVCSVMSDSRRVKLVSYLPDLC